MSKELEKLKAKVASLNEKIQELKQDTTQRKLCIDLDRAIEVYNEKNKETPLTKELLARELGVTYQSLVNYQNGRTPVVVGFIIDVMEKTGIKFSELIKEK